MPAATEKKYLLRRDFGLVDYAEMQAYMASFNLQRAADPSRDSRRDEIWFLQHPPIFTLGRNGNREHLLNPGSIPVLQSTRGGQVTYHGPGQLLVYPMLDARRMGAGPARLVRILEEAVIDLLQHYQVQGERQNRAPGVYAGGKKLASLGLRISQGLVSHGLSLNLDMDLHPFSLIHPCGFEGLKMTSLALEAGTSPDFDQVADQLFCTLQKRLAMQSNTTGPSRAAGGI